MDVKLNYLPGGYRVGAEMELSAVQKEQICHILAEPVRAGSALLRGRGNVIHTEISGLGRVVLKRFMRGGWLRHFVRQKFLRCGETRCQGEYRLLQEVRRVGVNAPEPIAFVYRGLFLYDAWLFTREVPNRINFADLARTDEDGAQQYFAELLRQISILVMNGIFHTDLHPGNVILDENGNLFIIDFDKARFFKGSRNKLRDLYLVRWRRAVIKHRLPESLSEFVCLGLRVNFDESGAGGALK